MTEKLKGVFARWCKFRKEFNALNMADPTEENRARIKTMRTEGEKLEGELAEALAAEPSGVIDVSDDGADDAEARERRQLRSKARVGRWIEAAITGRPVDGAEHEHAAAVKVTNGEMPIDILERQRPRPGVEERVVTPNPSTQAVQMAAIRPALFDRTVAPFLGIDMPMVGIGTPAYPYLSTSVTASMLAADAAAPETAGAFEVSTAEPVRLSGSFKVRREDLVKLAGMEESLRMNLESVIADQFDNQILNGNGTSPNLQGLLDDGGAGAAPTAPAANAETVPRYAAALSSHVDGLHAVMNRDVRALVGVQTYAHASSVFQNNSSLSAASYIEQTYGGFRSTRRIAAPASNVQQAIIRRGREPMVALAPTWAGLEFIRDPYSDKDKGQISITAVMLIGGLAFVRKAAFTRDSFRLA